MATLEHDVCDVHGASSLYIKTCWQSSSVYVYVYRLYIYIYIYIYTHTYIYTGLQGFRYWGDGGSPPPVNNLLFFHKRNFNPKVTNYF